MARLDTPIAPSIPAPGETADSPDPLDAERRHASFPSSHRPAGEEDHAPRGLGWRFLRDLGRGVAVVLLLHIFVVQISVVRGLSMQPSLEDGDRLIVDRLSYTFGEVSRFDVVVLRNPRDPSVDYVKRIVGLPGERVSIRDGDVEVDGSAVETGFEWIDDHTNMPEIIVPSGHFFVLGDNRPVSCDSREFGLVQGELLKGKVRFRFWPLSRIGSL